MTVEQFLNSWTRKHPTTVILCDYDDYDSMSDLVDEIRDGEENICSLEEYIIGAIATIPGLYNESCMLRDMIAQGTVKHFYIEPGYVVLWVDLYRSDCK